MSVHRSPLPSPHYVTLQGVQAVNGVPVVPFSPIVPPSLANATAFTSNALSHPCQKGMPYVGSPAPHFATKAVIEGRIKDIDLSQFTRNDEWLILVFIPMAWSFICPTEINAFDRRIHEFELRTCAVAFCSTDSEFVLQAWNRTPEEEGGLGGVHVPLISDRSHNIAKEYGVLIESEGVTQRAMFIIDPRGIVRQVTANDANVGRSVDEAKRLIDALKFTDAFGEGCPINWKKGDRGINMDSDSGDKKRNSTSGAATSPQSTRPKQVRMNTWSGNLPWLGGKNRSTGSPDTLTQLQVNTQNQQQLHQNMGVSDPGQRAESVPTANHNWGFTHQNSQKRVTTIDGTTELPPPQVLTKKVGFMGGYFFDPLASPLEQPQTVLNAMMHSAHR